MNFTYLVRPSSIVKNSFRSSRFTCIDMRHNTDVSDCT
ncbi:elongation factor G 1 domain protein [Chlamydia ibidis]|uniref:Elongation factor G 1 domain protein n=1 Tax=Chlamydia ibidis TaxID=1405396 RepID=S7J4U2_9CHLA|nr:elongation factor G 1 domain protein [Chlamydia ibidis]